MAGSHAREFIGRPKSRVGRLFWTLDSRFWIEEKSSHSGFFNPKSKSKIQNEFGCVTTCAVMYKTRFVLDEAPASGLR